MNNPLYKWRKQMIDFEHYRNNNLLSTVKGLKSSNTSRKVIDFFPEVDIQIGDIFINSGIKYYVTEVDTQTFKGETFAKKLTIQLQFLSLNQILQFLILIMLQIQLLEINNLPY